MSILDGVGYALVIVLAAVIHLPIHEQGHVLAMQWFGDRSATFELLPREGGKLAGFAIAGGDGKTTFTPQQDRIIDLAGMGLSRVFAAGMFGLSFFLHIQNPFLLVLWLALYLICRTDFLLYSVRDFISNHLRGDDFLIGDTTLFVRHTAQLRGWEAGRPQVRRLYLQVIALSALDTFTLCWTLPLMVKALTGA